MKVISKVRHIEVTCDYCRRSANGVADLPETVALERLEFHGWWLSDDLNNFDICDNCVTKIKHELFELPEFWALVSKIVEVR